MQREAPIRLKKAMKETTTPRAPVDRQLKIEALKKQKEALAAKIASMEARETGRKRKEDTRLKVIVGAAILANVGLHPETRRGVVAVLQKAVTAPRDREFLKAKGWL